MLITNITNSSIFILKDRSNLSPKKGRGKRCRIFWAGCWRPRGKKINPLSSGFMGP
jgi:hypothetical protein